VAGEGDLLSSPRVGIGVAHAGVLVAGDAKLLSAANLDESLSSSRAHRKGCSDHGYPEDHVPGEASCLGHDAIAFLADSTHIAAIGPAAPWRALLCQPLAANEVTKTCAFEGLPSLTLSDNRWACSASAIFDARRPKAACRRKRLPSTLGRRIDGRKTPGAEVAAWEAQRNANRARIKWMFATQRAQARSPADRRT